MERGALGELIPESGVTGRFEWETNDFVTRVYEYCQGKPRQRIASFFGPMPIRLERVALFLTTEQS